MLFFYNCLLSPYYVIRAILSSGDNMLIQNINSSGKNFFYTLNTNITLLIYSFSFEIAKFSLKQNIQKKTSF